MATLLSMSLQKLAEPGWPTLWLRKGPTSMRVTKPVAQHYT